MIIPMFDPGRGDFALTVAGGNNLVLSTVLTNAGWDGDSKPVVQFTSNVGSTTTTGTALTLDVDGARIVIPSGVYVSGAGGDGSKGYGNPGGEGGSPVLDAEDGGDAILVTAECEIANAGTIQGGGGGGSGAGYSATPGEENGDGGGGGAGLVVGQGGEGGNNEFYPTGTAGADGTISAGGFGGTHYMSRAGDGGDPGQAGGNAGANGGAAGKSITGYSLVTYSGAGDLLGPTA